MTAATKPRPWLVARPRCQWCGHHEATHTYIRTPSVVGECHGCTCAQFEAAPSFEQAQLEEQAQRSCLVWLADSKRALSVIDAEFGQWWRVVTDDVVHFALGSTPLGYALCGRLGSIRGIEFFAPGDRLTSGLDGVCSYCRVLAGGRS